jgi:hypothetical protein
VRLWVVLGLICVIGVLAATATGSPTGSFKLGGSVVHVVDGDTIDVAGLQLLRHGVARVYVYNRPFVRLGVYSRAEQAAKKSLSSLWHRCIPRGTRRCDPSYPDVCIPPPPPDLDCSDIQYRNFRVVGRDPHHFDGNHNGIGCER